MRLYLLAALAFLTFPESAFPADTDLAGSWHSGCAPLIKRHSVISRIEISGDGLVAVHRLYADRDCEVISLEIVSRGLHRELGSEFHWISGPVRLKLLSSEVVEHYNSRKICGLEGWSLGEPRDVTGLFCEPTQMPGSGVIYEDRYELREGVLEFAHFPELPDAKEKLFAKPVRYFREKD